MAFSFLFGLFLHKQFPVENLFDIQISISHLHMA